MDLSQQIEQQIETIEMLNKKYRSMISRSIEGPRLELVQQEIQSAGEELARLQYLDLQGEDAA